MTKKTTRKTAKRRKATRTRAPRPCRPPPNARNRRSRAPRSIVAQAHLDEVGAKAAAAASSLYREGRDRLRRQRGALASDRTIERRDPQKPARCGRHRVLGRPSARASDPRLGTMRSEFAAFAQQQAKAVVGRVARPAALGIIAGVFFLFAVAALFSALFFWLEPLYGPPYRGGDRCGGRSRTWALATLPLMVGRRAEPAPAPASDATLPQVVSLLAQSASSLGPKQSALTAVVLAVALGLMARGSSAGKR